MALNFSRAVLWISLLAGGGCSAMTNQSEYRWGNYASRNGDLYVIRQVAEVAEDPLPFPERSPPRIVSRHHELLVLTLSDGSLKKVEANLMPKEGTEDLDFVEIDEKGDATLWSLARLGDQLRRAAGIDCPGDIVYDEQDSRVVYFQCHKQGVAYRFEPPYKRACPIALGSEGGIPHPISDDYRFWSVTGSNVTFVTVGWAYLFEVDACGGNEAKELDRFTGPDDTFWREPAAHVLGWKQAEQLPYRLIGLGSDRRIYQRVDAANQAEVIVVLANEPTQRFKIPLSVYKSGAGKYLPASNRVIWNLVDDSTGSPQIHALDLGAGQLTSLNLPPAKASTSN